MLVKHIPRSREKVRLKRRRHQPDRDLTGPSIPRDAEGMAMVDS
jgi:hypothetical protein